MMIQYIWFNKENYVIKDSELEKNIICNFIKKKEIEYIRVSYWSEHCLECAAPMCYTYCENWVERYDFKCQNFFYGIYYNRKFKRTTSSAELKFRKWGKLESHIYPTVVKCKTACFMDSSNKIITNSTLYVSKFLKKILPKRNSRIRTAEYLIIRNLKNFKNNHHISTNVFLFQAYSYQANEYTLCIEIIDKNELVYRNAIKIIQGYNQTILDFENILDIGSVDGVIRIYPENDYEAELVILSADFIKLKKSYKTDNNIEKEILIKRHSGNTSEKIKCVAWDLDNTLWDGILIESDSQTLKLRNNVLETIKLLDAKGIIQVVISKNYESQADEVLKRLNIDHFFVYKMINWESKSSNLLHLSDLLNINTNTFALIDDSAFERQEVQCTIPCVRVYDENFADTIESFPEFNVPITEESQMRRQMYQTEVKRGDMKKNYQGTNLNFLKSCEIKIIIMNQLDDEAIKRSFELVQRTNQLNLSGIKYDIDEFNNLIVNNMDNTYIVHCNDKFGKYGQVAYMYGQFEGEVFCIKEFAMSCRVAGKYVESAIINWLQQHYQSKGIKKIVFKGINNQKNKLLITSLQNIGMVNKSFNKSELILETDVDKVIDNIDVVQVVES